MLKNRAKRPGYLAYMTFAGAILLVFGGSLGVDFFLDDVHLFERTERAALSPEDLAQAFTVFDPDAIDVWCRDRKAIHLFRPILILSFKLDQALFGANPAGFHGTNLLLHFLNCSMLFLLLMRLGLTRYQAWLSTLIFAVFCHNGVSVIWISGRSDVLMSTFLLAAMLFHSRFIELKRIGDLLFSLLFATAALMTKENAVILPCFLLSVEWIQSERNGTLWSRLRPITLRLAPVTALVVLFLVYRLFVFGSLTTPPRPYYFPPSDPGFPVFLGIKTAYYIFAWITTIPIAPVFVVHILTNNPLLAAAMITFDVVILVLVIRVLRREKPLGGLLLWLVACQVPVAMMMASSHYLYLGNAAIGAIAGMLLVRNGGMNRRRQVMAGVYLAIMLGFGIYNVHGYDKLAKFNSEMSASVAGLEAASVQHDPETVDKDIYFINLHLTGMHLGQRLRLFHGMDRVRAHLLSPSSEPFEFGEAPQYEWRGDRTLVLKFEKGIVSSELIEMMAMMDADLSLGHRRRAGPAWVEPIGEDEKNIHELQIEFDRAPDGNRIQVILFQNSPENKPQALSITPGGKKSGNIG